MAAWTSFEKDCEVCWGWKEGGEELGDQLLMPAFVDAAVGVDAQGLNAGPVVTAHCLTASLLLTQMGDDHIGVRAARGAPTPFAECP